MRTNNVCTLLCLLVISLTSCDHEITSETVVHPDGSLDKTVTFYMEDSASRTNVFGLSESSGWTRTALKAPGQPQGDDRAESRGKTMYAITYNKHFISADDLNAALSTPIDTLLQLRSTFGTKFRWFYTYTTYTESYQPINKLKLPVNDYITPEDSIFIERLPAEGKKISKADSLQLALLNEKIFDKYAVAAITDEYLQIMLKLMREQKTDRRWEDTLSVHRQRLFDRMIQENDVEDDYLPDALDGLGIPLDYAVAKRRFSTLSKVLENKLEFIGHAYEGKYNNSIVMPGDVVSTNADSVSLNRLFWRPPTVKFLLKAYTMYAETRQLNYWALAVSFVFVAFTALLFARKR